MLESPEAVSKADWEGIGHEIDGLGEHELASGAFERAAMRAKTIDVLQRAGRVELVEAIIATDSRQSAKRRSGISSRPKSLRLMQEVND